MTQSDGLSGKMASVAVDLHGRSEYFQRLKSSGGEPVIYGTADSDFDTTAANLLAEAAERIERLEHGLNEIDLLSYQTHGVTDSTMRVHETQCLSFHDVSKIVRAALNPTVHERKDNGND
jgi:hypothetical protein